jgi:hypothetical protein
MSRYHPVRPKKQTQQEQAAAPAAAEAAPMPTEAQMERVARERLKKAADEIYRMRGGDALDASIARWTRTLQLYDREQEVVGKKEPGEGHRWTVSPSIAFRADNHLHGLIARREALEIECWAEARKIIAELISDPAAIMNSLCPPKQTDPATEADPQPVTAKGAPANTGPIAA